MLNKLVSGLFSIALVLLTVIGPLYLAEQLEKVETASGDLVSTSQIISQSNTTYTYSPYLELNADTGTVMDYGDTYYGVRFRFLTSDNFYQPESVTYNYNDFQDYVTVSNGNVARYVILCMEVNPSEMLANGMDEVSLYYESTESTHVTSLRFVTRDISGSEESERTLGYTPEGSYSSTPRTIDYTLTSTDLNNMVSDMGGAFVEYGSLEWWILYESAFSEDIICDYEINSEYMEVETITYDNSTVESYIPHVQTFTPYAVHKVAMAIGALLIAVGSVIASPLPIGERFDSVFPVSNFTGKRTRGGKR